MALNIHTVILRTAVATGRILGLLPWYHLGRIRGTLSFGLNHSESVTRCWYRLLVCVYLLPMSYLLTFTSATARYSAHAATCTAAKGTRNKVALPEVFESIAAAVEYATADESDKGSSKVLISVCKCTK